VWIAEQKAEEENKKVAELQKQIAEERQIQELRRLQAAAGHVVKTVDTTLDWMYEGPASSQQQQQTNEEYLLGKVYEAKETKTSDLHKVGKYLNSSTTSVLHYEKYIASIINISLKFQH
jgi:Pre-mRNA splicing factor/N-terminal domain of CBF1 interacting co-repressor CIR